MRYAVSYFFLLNSAMSNFDNFADGLVDRVYDISVSPERMEDLIDKWTARLNGGPYIKNFGALSEPPVFKHVQRAERILRELIALSVEDHDSARDWVENARAAAIVVSRAGVVVAVNAAARATLSLSPGNALSALPVVPDDLALLTELIEHLDTARDTDVRLLRLKQVSENAPILIRIVESVGGDPDQIGLVTSVLAWPAILSAQLTATFRLTQSEALVLKDLTLGFSVKEIAERTGRFESTIRSHVHALLEKTGTRSQLELVRVTLGLLDVVEQPPLIAPMRGPPGVSPQPNHYHTLILDDGRKLDYLAIGDPLGRPFLMLPSDMGFTRLPPKAEGWLADNRMRMIVPVRAGYGHSSPIPKRRDAYEVAVSDMFELCGHLGIERCPILALCDDFHLAIATAIAAPHRVTAIVGIGPTMPANEPKHFQRMPKWTRFMFANARYAPRAFPYLVMAFFQCIRRLGPRRFMQTVMATSEADLRVIEDDEILTAMLQGTEISVGPRFTAHVAWAAGALSNYGIDWSAKLKSCPAPMILFAGLEDPIAPIETTREFAAITPLITLHEIPEAGQLLYPHWPQFLGQVQRYLAN